MMKSVGAPLPGAHALAWGNAWFCVAADWRPRLAYSSASVRVRFCIPGDMPGRIRTCDRGIMKTVERARANPEVFAKKGWVAIKWGFARLTLSEEELARWVGVKDRRPRVAGWLGRCSGMFRSRLCTEVGTASAIHKPTYGGLLDLRRVRRGPARSQEHHDASEDEGSQPAERWHAVPARVAAGLLGVGIPKRGKPGAAQLRHASR
jgi:hypothetical protein